MVIQFGCPGCQQPIEVDPQWAGEHVACPFCRKVVTAPTASTLDIMQRSTPPSARRVTPAAPGTATVGARSNRLAVLGLIFSVSAVALYIIAQVLFYPLASQLGPTPKPEDAMKLAEDPAMMVRMIAGLAAMSLVFLSWVAGLILSLIALTQPDRPGRRYAIAGALCATLVPTTLCGGFLMMN